MDFPSLGRLAPDGGFLFIAEDDSLGVPLAFVRREANLPLLLDFPALGVSGLFLIKLLDPRFFCAPGFEGSICRLR